MLVTSVCKGCLNLDTNKNIFFMHSVTEQGFLFIVLCCVSYASLLSSNGVRGDGRKTINHLRQLFCGSKDSVI